MRNNWCRLCRDKYSGFTSFSWHLFREGLLPLPNWVEERNVWRRIRPREDTNGLSKFCLEPLAQAIEKLDFLNLKLTIEAQDHIELPVFSGSTFRGLLGHELKRAACLTGESCERCREPGDCIYHYLFETQAPPTNDPIRGSREVPRPFILIPPTVGRVLPAGQQADLALRIIGRATEYLSYFLYAIEQAGSRGIGRERRRFRLVKVSQIARPDNPPNVFYEVGSTGGGRYVSEPAQGSLNQALRPLRLGRECEIRFLTPTRLKHRGQLVETPEFHVLVRALLTRLGILIGAHGKELLKLKYREIVKLAESATHDAQNVRWLDWQRYSNRQKRKMKMGGFVGRVVYRGDIEPFAPLLAAGELLNVGKGTTFGLGSFLVERQD